jgi:hypothetical protein
MRWRVDLMLFCLIASGHRGRSFLDSPRSGPKVYRRQTVILETEGSARVDLAWSPYRRHPAPGWLVCQGNSCNCKWKANSPGDRLGLLGDSRVLKRISMPL